MADKFNLEVIMDSCGPIDTPEAVISLVKELMKKKEEGLIDKPLGSIVLEISMDENLYHHAERQATATDYAINNKTLFDKVPEFRTIEETIQYLMDHHSEFPRQKGEGILSLGYLATTAIWAGKIPTNQQQKAQRQAGAADYYLNNKEPFEQIPDFKSIEKTIQYLIDHRSEFPTDKEGTLSLGYLVDAAVWAGKIPTNQQQKAARRAAAADYYLNNKEPFEQIPDFKSIEKTIQYLIDHRSEFPTDKEGTLSLVYLVDAALWAGKIPTNQQQRASMQAAAADYAINIKEYLEDKIKEAYSPETDDPDHLWFSKRLFDGIDSSLFANQKTLKIRLEPQQAETLNERIRKYCTKEKDKHRISMTIQEWCSLEKEDREYMINSHGVKIISDAYKDMIRKYAMLLYGNQAVQEKLNEFQQQRIGNPLKPAAIANK